MLVAYMDESGTHDPSGVQAGSVTPTIAGYLADFRVWVHFEKQWRKVLRRYGLWGRFHMKQYVAGRGEFNGWSVRKRDSFMTALCRVIREHELTGLGGVVFVKDYDSAMPQWAKDEIKHPYYFCFAAMMKSLSQWNPAIPLGRIDFIFDQKEGYQGYTEEMFYNLRKLNPIHAERLGSIRFRSSDDSTPLQAADLLAYEVRRYAAEFVNPDARPIRASMRALMDDTTLIIGKADAEYFRSHVEARRRQLGMD